MNHSWWILVVIVFVSLAINVWAREEKFDNEDEEDAYYKWFGMTREEFSKDLANSKERLSKKYRKMALLYHPDKNKTDDPETAKQKFFRIGRAFETLNDDKKREQYNFGGAKAVRDGPGGGAYSDPFDIYKSMFEDIFEGFGFGGAGGGGGGGGFGRGRTGRGSNSQTELSVALEDLYMGRTMHVEYSRITVCKKCHGTGAADEKSVKICGKCKGQGSYIAVHQIAPGFIQQMQMECDACNGRGKSIGKACPSCKGQRVHREQERVEIVIPPGTSDKHAFRFEGMADEHPDRRTGDLIVIVRTREHALFQRDGINLYVDVHLSLKQALNGFSITLPHLDGSPLTIVRKAVTQPEFSERIHGKGMPRLKGGFGDLFVKYHVILPINLSRTHKDTLEKILPGPETTPLYSKEDL